MQYLLMFFLEMYPSKSPFKWLCFKLSLSLINILKCTSTFWCISIQKNKKPRHKVAFSLSFRCISRYTTPQLGTMRRQQLLQSQWYFSCQCQRCLDPHELGSEANSVICNRCKIGVMVPLDPTKITSEWVCSLSNSFSEITWNLKYEGTGIQK